MERYLIFTLRNKLLRKVPLPMRRKITLFLRLRPSRQVRQIPSKIYSNMKSRMYLARRRNTRISIYMLLIIKLTRRQIILRSISFKRRKGRLKLPQRSLVVLMLHRLIKLLYVGRKRNITVRQKYPRYLAAKQKLTVINT